MSYEPCSSCRGSGLQDSGWGITDCYYCRGNGEVRKRDAKGRFCK